MIYYHVEIAQQFPEGRDDPNAPRWEALVEMPDAGRRTVAKTISREWQAMEIAIEAINRLRLINDPKFEPHARWARAVNFDQLRAAYSEVDFTFPHFITDDNCRVWFLRKPHPEVG